MGLFDSLFGGGDGSTPSAPGLFNNTGATYSPLDAMFLAMASTPPGGKGGIPLLQATQLQAQLGQQQAERQANQYLLQNYAHMDPQTARMIAMGNPQTAALAMNMAHSADLQKNIAGLFGGDSSQPAAAPASPGAPVTAASPASSDLLSPTPTQDTPALTPPASLAGQGASIGAPIGAQPSQDSQPTPQAKIWLQKVKTVQPQIAGVQQTPQGAVAVNAQGRPLISIASIMKAGAGLAGSSFTADQAVGKALTDWGQTMLKQGVVPTRDGGVMPIPGYADAKARQAYMEGQGKYSARAQNTPMTVYDANGFGRPVSQFDVLHGGATPAQAPAQQSALTNQVADQPTTLQQPAAPSAPGAQPSGTFTEIPKVVGYKQQQVAEYNTKIANEADGLSNQQQRLQEIQRLLQEYQTGKWAGAKGEFIAALNSLGADIGLKSRVTNTANPADYEVFLKDATKTVFDNLKQLGGRPLVSEIQGLSKSVMNPELQPDANIKIVGQLLGAVNGRMAHNQAFSNWYQNNQYATDYTPFENAWYKEHPYSGYVKEAERGTPALGQDIPPPIHRDPQTVYMTKLGPARWDPASKVWTKVTQLPDGTWR